MADFSDTIAALSTPNAESALALIRLSGGNCLDLASSCFCKKEISARQATHGFYHKKNSKILDDCIFTYFANPSSYTGEDMLEICCHGNPFIVQNILEDLFSRGVRAAEHGEFTRRAFLNGKFDLSQAEAVSLIIASRSEKSLEAARKQLGGELSKRINSMCDYLVEALAYTEAYIDFSDEDLPKESFDRQKNLLLKFCEEAEKLAATSQYGAILREGLNIAILGEPNAGKSSLLNRLLGRNRAIVSAVAGTTRDFISEKMQIGGFLVNLTDTAGLRNSTDEIEREGISRALELARDADLKLLIVDGSKSAEFVFDIAKNYLDKKNTIIVVNKSDLPKSEELKLPIGFEVENISCLKDEGIVQLKNLMAEFIARNSIVPSSDDILVSARHVDLVKKSLACAQSAVAKIEQLAPSELIASDIRESLDNLGEIVGRVDKEEILDKIFSTFCIGK